MRNNRINISRSRALHQTVLYIDDARHNLLLRRAQLEGLGYKVLTAMSGRGGLRLLSERHVDAVVVDYEMPGMNGGVVAAAIKHKKPMIPIIMLTGWTGKLPIFVSSVIDDFVEKGEPTGKQLIASIKKQLARLREAA